MPTTRQPRAYICQPGEVDPRWTGDTFAFVLATGGSTGGALATTGLRERPAGGWPMTTTHPSAAHLLDDYLGDLEGDGAPLEDHLFACPTSMDHTSLRDE